MANDCCGCCDCACPNRARAEAAESERDGERSRVLKFLEDRNEMRRRLDAAELRAEATEEKNARQVEIIDVLERELDRVGEERDEARSRVSYLEDMDAKRQVGAKAAQDRLEQAELRLSWWDERWMRVQADLLDADQEIKRLRRERDELLRESREWKDHFFNANGGGEDD